MMQVIDPAGSSHIFSQFEGGLVYFRFQVGFQTFEIFDFDEVMMVLKRRWRKI